MSGDSLTECFLLVPELTAARAFYESVLGLSVADADDQSATYDVGAVTFKLQADYPPEVFQAFNLEAPAETGRGEGAFFAVGLDDDLDAVYRRVADSDGTALTEPQSVDWLDSRMCLVRDPYGYTLELREQIP
ncbi:VOC family protein [Halobellus sp. GM3]|uniref:VOC family protein n=1 Tax=Halobellus sp. GM3 TaxID=3458410 RepID=UPI00403D9424